MKHENLKIMKEAGLNIPDFIVIDPFKQKCSLSNRYIMSFLKKDKEYAVRSSVGCEDSGEYSYAGQFKTLLNVKIEGIDKAIEEVKKSFNRFHTECYSGQNENIRNSRIIIQEMIFSEISGVVFTANPMGILNETVITVGKGLGENIVSDKISGTTYYYNNDDNTYIYDGEDILNEALISSLISISQRIKNLFSYEVDIEFAVKDGRIFILQARPITTLKTNIAPIILDDSNIVESYPGISLPLTQNFVKDIYSDIFKNLAERVIGKRKEVENLNETFQYMVDVYNGKIYYRISNWYDLLFLLPFSKKIIKVWQEMLGISNKYIPKNKKRISVFTKLSVISFFVLKFWKTPKEMERLNKDFEILYPSYRERLINSKTIEELLFLYESIKTEILQKWDITLINDMYAFIFTALTGKKNRYVINNIKNLASIKPNKMLNELIRLKNEIGTENNIFKEKVEEYIDKYGDRCVCELKLETKTYRTNPELLIHYINSQTECISECLPHTENKTGFFLKRAKIGIQNREISRLNRSKLYGLTRDIFLKIGKVLEEKNEIEKPEDVFYLYIGEIKTKQNKKRIIAARQIEYEEFKKMPLNSRLVFNERITERKHLFKEKTLMRKNGILSGTATSFGKVKGEVVVISDTENLPDTNGKILITKSTDPGWLFLIRPALGIISEKGSLLSHTAIISRELNKPAIVNVKDCTKILKNGDIIELNAEAGTITILKRKVEGNEL